MHHQIEVRGGQNGSQQGSTNGQGGSGQMSERVGQQATDITVQTDGQNGAQHISGTPDPLQEMQNRPQSSGVGS
jgi:HSP20 family protein